MKLSRIIFEYVDELDIIDELLKPLQKKWARSDVADTLKSYSYTEDPYSIAETFYKQNKDIFDKILKTSKVFKYLASGSYGDAYDIGDKILKIELTIAGDFSSTERANKSEEQLWGKTSLGGSVPMIYDKGTLIFNGAKLLWIILEKFETIDFKDKSDLAINVRDILEGIFRLIIDKLYSAEQLRIAYNRGIPKITEFFRLKSDWVERLVSDMENLDFEGFNADYHIGNIGIRRTGGEGYFVFFD